MVCAYKHSRKCLDFQVKSENGAILALTLRLRRRGKFALPRYHADLTGGKGGTRTLDPGIMSAFLGSEVFDFTTFGQTAVAAKCLKVHRRAGEIPANLPRARMYCGEQTSRPCAPLVQLLERSFSVHPPRTTARTTLPRARGRTEQGLTRASNTDLAGLRPSRSP